MTKKDKVYATKEATSKYHKETFDMAQAENICAVMVSTAKDANGDIEGSITWMSNSSTLDMFHAVITLLVNTSQKEGADFPVFFTGVVQQLIANGALPKDLVNVVVVPSPDEEDDFITAEDLSDIVH